MYRLNQICRIICKYYFTMVLPCPFVIGKEPADGVSMVPGKLMLAVCDLEQLLIWSVSYFYQLGSLLHLCIYSLKHFSYARLFFFKFATLNSANLFYAVDFPLLTIRWQHWLLICDWIRGGIMHHYNLIIIPRSYGNIYCKIANEDFVVGMKWWNVTPHTRMDKGLGKSYQ